MTDAIAALVALAPDPASRTGRVFQLKGSIRTAFDHALERAGIPKGTDPTSRVSFHTLRHTAASWLTIKGASLRSVQEILGTARRARRPATPTSVSRTFGPTSSGWPGWPHR